MATSKDQPPQVLRARPGHLAAYNVPGQGFQVPDPARAYSADDPIVKAFPDAFGPEAEVAAEQREAREQTSVVIPRVPQPDPVERATRGPGEKRGAVKKAQGPITTENFGE